MANAIIKADRADFPLSLNFSARPKPKGIKSKTFRNASKNPLFWLLPKKNGDAPFGSRWKLKRKGYIVKNKMPAVASIKIRFDQLDAGWS